MMGYADIQALVDRATKESEEELREPLYVSPGMLREMRNGTQLYALPFLGDYVPPGWERTETEEYFCDTSGMGQPGERALTQEEFLAKMEAGYGYAVVEMGQFQCYVAQYQEDWEDVAS
jgi:hypothetical protein